MSDLAVPQHILAEREAQNKAQKIEESNRLKSIES